jgi:HAE1 family hydrophobic/amphiphilic exporter-1
MGLTRIAVKRPVAILMLIATLIVLGFQGYFKMPAEQNPKVDFPRVSVFTTYAGTGPQEMETLITKPIEDAVSSVSGIKNITSVSQEGTSSVNIEFYLGTPLDVAASDVREKVDGVRRRLPTDADPPTISKADVNASPILFLSMRSTANRPSKELRDLADNQVKDALGQVPGVANIFVTGGDQREISVALDKGRLDAYSLTVTDVANAIRAQNLNVPSGKVTEGNRDYSVRVIGEFKSVDELANLRLNFEGKNGQPNKNLFVSDLGIVRDSYIERTESATIAARTEQKTAIAPGTDTISLAVQKTSDGNTIQAAAGVKKKLEDLKRILPSDVQFNLTQDQSLEVTHNLDDVLVTLIIGAVLAVLIVYLFLHNLRGTIIVALAIPTSIIATFGVMNALGFTLNSMTLLGLSLAVGILVDDSIVVLENIYRHLAMGETPQEAALNGRSEIGLAAVTITMVDVVVFVPVAFMGGIVGQFFRSFGITVAVATLFSLLMSFTLAPMLASRWFKKGETFEAHEGVFGAINRFYASLEHGYRRALIWALKHRSSVVFMGNMALVLIILWMATAGAGSAVGFRNGLIVGGVVLACGLLVAGIGLVRRKFSLEPIVVSGMAAGLALLVALGSGAVGRPLGFRFAPGQDQAQVNISVELPAGASLAATTRILKQIEDRIRDVPEVKFIETSAGSSSAGGFQGGGSSGTQYGQVRLKLYDKLGNLDRVMFWTDQSDKRPKSDIEVAGDIRKRVSDIPGARIITSEVSGFNGASAPVQIELNGPDQNELVAKAKEVEATIAKIPGILTPDISFKASKPEVQVRLDRARVAQYGLSLQTVANALSDAIQGNILAKYRDDATGEQYDIRVQYAKLDRSSVAEVGSVIVGSKEGSPIRLADVASIINGAGPTKIDRRNRQRQVTVSAYLAPGKVIGNMQQVINPELKKINFGKATYQWEGEANTLAEEGAFMLSALLLAITLVYILMAALFENLLYPLIIMLTIPQALVGGLLALIIANVPLSIIAMIGVIMLMGLVTKNAILLVDYTNTLRSRGYRRNDALTEAGPARLRPILMTTLAQILGALPIALALGAGSEFRQSLGIVIIGGLTLSAFLTLLVIPCTYTVFDDISTWFSRVRYGRGLDVDSLIDSESVSSRERALAE